MTDKKKSDEDKKPVDMTSEELASEVFPPEVIDHLKEVAQGVDNEAVDLD
jgi:DNA-directed RNA polymerase subunit K/omega